MGEPNKDSSNMKTLNFNLNRSSLLGYKFQQSNFGLRLFKPFTNEAPGTLVTINVNDCKGWMIVSNAQTIFIAFQIIGLPISPSNFIIDNFTGWYPIPIITTDSRAANETLTFHVIHPILGNHVKHEIFFLFCIKCRQLHVKSFAKYESVQPCELKF